MRWFLRSFKVLKFFSLEKYQNADGKKRKRGATSIPNVIDANTDDAAAESATPPPAKRSKGVKELRLDLAASLKEKKEMMEEIEQTEEDCKVLTEELTQKDAQIKNVQEACEIALQEERSKLFLFTTLSKELNFLFQKKTLNSKQKF